MSCDTTRTGCIKVWKLGRTLLGYSVFQIVDIVWNKSMKEAADDILFANPKESLKTIIDQGGEIVIQNDKNEIVYFFEVNKRKDEK